MNESTEMGLFQKAMEDVSKGRTWRIIQGIRDVLFGYDSHSKNRYESAIDVYKKEIDALKEKLTSAQVQLSWAWAESMNADQRANDFENKYLDLLEKYDPVAYARYGEEDE